MMKSKNIYKLIILSSFALTLFSCKKDHTCFCNNNYIDVGGFTIHGTKKYAKQKCTEYETNGLIGYETTGCEIKD